jgi:microcystin-dependent protein
MFAGNFEPYGWRFCNGQLLPISENEPLYYLIGTAYGGDGQDTFALPNLQSRFPMHQGTGPSGNTYLIGETGGTESVTLTTEQIPPHRHVPIADGAGGNTGTPQDAQWAESALLLYQQNPDSVVAMSPQALAPAGGSQPHDNMPPFLGIHFIISLFGVFPSQN